MRLARIATVAVVLFGLPAAAGDAGAQACPKGKLRFYTSWPMQGAIVPEGTGMKNGVDLAVSGGVVGAKWAKRLGPKKVYVLNDHELYGKGIADVFEATGKKIGLPVVPHEGIDWKQPDQKPLLTKIRASGADLVYLGGVIETGAQVIIRQMKEVGLTAPRTR